MKFLALLLSGAVVFAGAAQAHYPIAAISIAQRRECVTLPPRPAAPAGFITVGAQTRTIYTEALPVRQHCHWAEDGAVRTIYLP